MQVVEAARSSSRSTSPRLVAKGVVAMASQVRAITTTGAVRRMVEEATIILTAKMINNTNTTAQIETIMEAATDHTLDFFNITAKRVATNVNLLYHDCLT